jgi:hypothetical protein
MMNEGGPLADMMLTLSIASRALLADQVNALLRWSNGSVATEVLVTAALMYCETF